MKSNTYLREKEKKNKISLTLLPTVAKFDSTKDSSTLECSVGYSFNNIHKTFKTKYEYSTDFFFKNIEGFKYFSQFNLYEYVIPAIENKYKIKIDDSSDSLHINEDGMTGKLTLNYKKVA